MNDTSAEMELIHRRLMMARDGWARLQMGCDMFDTAKAIAIAGLRPSERGCAQAALFQRFYRDDFDPVTRERILARLA